MQAPPTHKRKRGGEYGGNGAPGSSSDDSEAAEELCVRRNEVHHTTAERTLVQSDVVTDPTLPRTNTVDCPKCNHGEAVFFQSTSRNDAEAMTLFFVCTNCGERWRES